MPSGPHSGSPNSESGMADGRWRVPHDDWTLGANHVSRAPEMWVAHSASGNLRLGHRAPGRGGRRASIPFKALPAHLSSLGAFYLFELRVFETFLDILRSICSGH